MLGPLREEPRGDTCSNVPKAATDGNTVCGNDPDFWANVGPSAPLRTRLVVGSIT